LIESTAPRSFGESLPDRGWAAVVQDTRRTWEDFKTEVRHYQPESHPQNVDKD
jgi:hypothetical protein